MIERLHEEFRHRVKTQGSLPSEDAALVLLHPRGGRADQVAQDRRLAEHRRGGKPAPVVEGRDFVIEYRWAGGKLERLPELAAALVRLKMDVLVSPGTLPTLAAKNATREIPVVFPVAADPVGSGLVASLARPGGNVTGFSSQSTDLTAKRLELMKEALPRVSRVAVLWNSANPAMVRSLRDARAAAATLEGICECRWSCGIWARPVRLVSARGHLRGQDPERG